MHMRGIIATSDFKIEIAYIRSLDPSDIFQFSVATTEMSSTETGASLCNSIKKRTYFHFIGDIYMC